MNQNPPGWLPVTANVVMFWQTCWFLTHNLCLLLPCSKIPFYSYLVTMSPIPGDNLYCGHLFTLWQGLIYTVDCWGPWGREKVLPCCPFSLFLDLCEGLMLQLVLAIFCPGGWILQTELTDMNKDLSPCCYNWASELPTLKHLKLVFLRIEIQSILTDIHTFSPADLTLSGIKQTLQQTIHKQSSFMVA